jgi:hypothetical protein
LYVQQLIIHMVGLLIHEQKGLAKFERRTLYTNIVNDRSTVYYTTSISSTDPFANLENVKLNYIPGYSDVVLDPNTPVEPLEPKETEPSFYETFIRSSHTTIGRLPLLLAMIFFIPFGVLAFLINSGVQSLRSSRRIRLHERGLAGIEPGNYRVPLLITGMREAVEDVYENLNSAQSHEYLVAGTEEETADTPPPSLPSSPLLKSTPGPTTTDTKSKHGEKGRGLEVPTLALAPYQFRMIKALDGLGWRKYPVYIHNSNHSHAAIVVRIEKPSFDEGRIVLRHWLDEEFIL